MHIHTHILGGPGSLNASLNSITCLGKHHQPHQWGPWQLGNLRTSELVKRDPKVTKRGHTLTRTKMTNHIRLSHFFALIRGLGLRLGYLATSSAKSGMIFLLRDPDFPRSDVGQTDRQTTADRGGDRNRRLSH